MTTTAEPNTSMNAVPHFGKLAYSDEELKLVISNSLPRHIGIIPDGNRRWAKNSDLSVQRGYLEGAETFINIVGAARQIGIETLTVYFFSTENWKRPRPEIDQYMQTVEVYIKSHTQKMRENGIRLSTIGDISGLPTSLQNILKIAIDETCECSKLNLVLALNYGGRDELTRAFKKIASQVESHTLKASDITDKLISQHLDTAGLPDPDLIIRTSGEQRLSNFLLWQASYAEVVIEETFWPDFSPQKFLNAILEFQTRTRRQGT